MVALLLFYLLVLLGGFSVSMLCGVRGTLSTVLITFTAGAAQLVFAVQALSVFRVLNATGLFLLTGVLTAVSAGAAVWLRRKLPRPLLERSSASVVAEAWRHPLLIACLVVAAGAFASYMVASFGTFPSTDSYHFAMPLFWRQHESILPFAVNNPRTIGVVFAGEALALPGFLYANTYGAFQIINGIAIILLCAVVYGLGREIGLSTGPAVFASILTLGCSSVSMSAMSGSPDLALGGLWMASSVYFLLKFRDPNENRTLLVFASVFCFAMATGAKNVVTIQGPVYAIGLLIVAGRSLFRPRILAAGAVAALLGLVASGTIWSYVANIATFNNPRGHAILQETVATDWSASGIWTRIVRSTVHSFFDPIYVPSSLQPTYKEFILGSVRALGGKDNLPDDNEYYSLTKQALRPGRGLGMLGMVVLVPGILAGLAVLFRKWPATAEERIKVLALLVLTCGSVLLSFSILRTQSIGIARLMISSVVLGFPLAGLLWNYHAWRWAAAAAFIACTMAYSALGWGLTARRTQIASLDWLVKKVFRPDKAHATRADVLWTGEPATHIEFLEPRMGVLLRPFFDRFPSRLTLGVIGGVNTEEYDCFGRNHDNTVIALGDCRKPDVYLPAPRAVDYIIVQLDKLPEALTRTYPEFEVALQVLLEGEPSYFVLRRKPLDSQQQS